MRNTNDNVEELARALAACPSVTEPSPEREALMLAIWRLVCTQGPGWRTAVPMGSSAAARISAEYASTEFLAVMNWLRLHEAEARRLKPAKLWRMARAVATRGHQGSARAARTDGSRGVVGVPPGDPISFVDVDKVDYRVPHVSTERPRTVVAFPEWVAAQTGYDLELLAPLRLAGAFDVVVLRVEEAARRGAADPLSVVMNAVAGGNSRALTRRELGRLGYNPPQLRVVHRLVGGSKSGWRGLVRAYCDGDGLTTDERDYVRRQVRTYLALVGAAGQDLSGSIA
jgi:hypothetical protein